MKQVLVLALLLLSAGVTATAWAAAPAVRVNGRKSVTVTTTEIRLGDLADVTSNSSADDEVVIGLKKVHIDKSPAPGEISTISAAQVLERLKEEGIKLDQLGYTFPRVMSVSRAGREITIEEVSSAIEKSLEDLDRDVELRTVEYRKPVHVAPGPLKLEASPSGLTEQGIMNFLVKAIGETGAAKSFRVKANVNEWREFPVANRPIERGAVVSPNDVIKARLNVQAIPKDVAVNESSIVGFETSKPIGAGEVFRRNALSIPPTIKAGQSVTLVYRTNLLEATATGTAVDAGAQGQTIKVKNETSKRIVSGTIIDGTLVQVN